MGSVSLYFLIMEKINVFDVQIPDGRQIRCMSLGFKVGEDEHAAYIAGFAGGCAYDFLYSNSTE